MRISDSTIQKVKDLDIVQVIGGYLTLKAKGGRHSACCPFHDEKTPSFSVTPAKQIFKCYGCGQAGDGIRFVMEKEGLGFIQAVEEIANKHSVPIEYEQQTEEEKQEAEKVREERKSLQLLLEFAVAYYQGNDLPEEWVKKRALYEQTLLNFKVGYAPNEKNKFYLDAIKAGYTAEQLVKAGLVRENEGTSGKYYYDYFQDRILLPIHDYRGRVVAFTGRLLTEPAPDADFKPGKYLNSPEATWTKGDHLYGLHLAIKAIQLQKFAYLVEGNIDVQSWHQRGINNTVAPCGTALTLNQINLLKRYTDTVCIVPDNDPAGIKALEKNAQLLIEQGFFVKVLIPGAGMDPDEQVKKFRSPDKLKAWLNKSQDYISNYLVDDCEKNSLFTIKDKLAQLSRMYEVLESIPTEMVRQAYYDDVSGRWKEFKNAYKYKSREKAADADTKLLEKLSNEQKVASYDFGYYEKDGSYHTMEKGREVMICNFTIDILYFVRTNNESKYVCLFRNMFNETEVYPVSTDEFSGVNSVKKKIGKLGNFIFKGNEEQLDRIKMKLFHGVKKAMQPRYMGYSSGGDFYTWANGIFYAGEFTQADKYGIVTLRVEIKDLKHFQKLKPQSQIVISGQVFIIKSPSDFIQEYQSDKLEVKIEANEVYLLKYYYLPFSTSLILNTDEDDDDNYEMERRFKHYQVPGLDFETWANLIVEAYGTNGKIMVCYYVAALFRDIIFRENDNYFPILNHFGPPQAGKSKAAESLAVMFGDYPNDGVNISSGSTTTAIIRYISSVKNGLIWINEYKNTIQPFKIEMLKGIADGNGKITGRNTGGNETKSYTPQSAAILSGQDLPTQEAALLSRTVTLEFSDETKASTGDSYERLKDLEKTRATTSVTCELLQYREIMKRYGEFDGQVSTEIREKCKELFDIKPTDRALLNVSSMLVPYKILSELGMVKFPFTYAEILDSLVNKIKLQVEIQATSDDVEQYFNVLASVVGRMVIENEHFKVIKESDGIAKLFLRTRAVHGFYKEAAAKQSIVPLGESTIRSYLKKHRTFIEERDKGVEFTKLSNTTSALVFNYDLMLKQGIEFKIGDNLDQMTPKDDPSAAHKIIKLNGNIPELMSKFLRKQPVDKDLPVKELLKDFNSNKQPKLDHNDFVAAIQEHAATTEEWDFLMSEDQSFLKITVPF